MAMSGDESDEGEEEEFEEITADGEEEMYVYSLRCALVKTVLVDLSKGVVNTMRLTCRPLRSVRLFELGTARLVSARFDFEVLCVTKCSW